MALLEFAVREDLNKRATRVMAIFEPLRVVLTNYEEQIEFLEIENNPEDPSSGKRLVPFGKDDILSKRILWKILLTSFFA